MARRSLLLLLAGLLALGACVRRVSYDADEARQLHRVAIVVRVLGSAVATLPEGQQAAGKDPAALGKRIEAAMGAYEVAERVRSAMEAHLPDAPPWSTLAPSVQIDSVLGNLLTVDRPAKPPEFDELDRLGVDGVVYVEITGWGVETRDNKAGFALHGVGRMFTLPDHGTLWQEPVDAFGTDALPANWQDPSEIRQRFGDLCEQVGREVALSLGGSREPVERTPSLHAPDIEDTGHPPEKRQPVIPFVIESDGGAPAQKKSSEPPLLTPPSATDGGDPLFPGPLPR